MYLSIYSVYYCSIHPKKTTYGLPSGLDEHPPYTEHDLKKKKLSTFLDVLTVACCSITTFAAQIAKAPLHYAAWQGHVEVAKAHSVLGPRDCFQVTPMLQVAFCHHPWSLNNPSSLGPKYVFLFGGDCWGGTISWSLMYGGFKMPQRWIQAECPKMQSLTLQVLIDGQAGSTRWAMMGLSEMIGQLQNSVFDLPYFFWRLQSWRVCRMPHTTLFCNWPRCSIYRLYPSSSRDWLTHVS